MVAKRAILPCYLRRCGYLGHYVEASDRPARAHQEVGAGKQDVETVHVLCKAAVRHLAVSKIPLDDEEDVLHLAANGCFSLLYTPLPVDAVTLFLDASRALVDAVLHLRQVRVLPHDLLILHPQIARVAVHLLVVLPHQLVRLLRIMFVGRRAGYRVRVGI